MDTGKRGERGWGGGGKGGGRKGDRKRDLPGKWERGKIEKKHFAIFALKVNRGCYTVARRYEFYIGVATDEILFFFLREHNFHIFEPTCNVRSVI